MMKQVKYKEIARKYDQNPERTKYMVVDGDLFNFIHKNQSDTVKVLDVACGTGIYLKCQQRFLPHNNIEWMGIDADEDMLEIAKSKVPNSTFVKSKAESLPFNSETFDYLYCSFAFHHFVDKSEALREMYRVLKLGGFLKIITISPEFLDRWYIYKFFPESKKIDLDRCWKSEKILNSMEELGFKTEMRIEYIHQKFPARILYDIAKNRDISELVLLDDSLYREGLDRLKNEDAQNTVIASVFTKITLKGIKSYKKNF